MNKIYRSQIAGLNLHYAYYTFEKFLDSMERFGIETVELWGGAPHFFVDDVSYSEVKTLAADLSRRKLTLACFTPEQVIYPYNIAAVDGRLRERSLQYFRKNITAAADLGAPLMLMTSGWGYFTVNTTAAWERSRDALHRLAEFAGKNGVTLVMETLRPEESNLVTNLPALRRMIAEVNSPHLKPCLDTIAMSVAGESIQDFFDAFGPDVTHCHFVDGTPYGHLAWGEGKLPLEEFIIALNLNHYTGHLGLELTESAYFADPDAPIAKTMHALGPYLA